MSKITVGGIEIETEREREQGTEPYNPAAENNGWISVEDQLPPDLHEVMYFAINAMGTTEIMTGHREHGLWMHCCMFYSSMRCDNTITVTHWMELPDYPRSK